MDLREISCSFTGHRPNRCPWLLDSGDLRTRALTQALWERIIRAREEGYTRFLSGMAQGVDLLCAQLVLKLRAEDPDVALVPVLPYPGQADHWKAAVRRTYQGILQVSQRELIIVSPQYTRSCFWARNRYLVDHSAKIIGVYDGRPKGGTHQTLRYAKAQGLEMELLVPD